MGNLNGHNTADERQPRNEADGRQGADSGQAGQICKSGKYAGRAFIIWLIALVVFLGGLAAALFGGPALHGGEAGQQAVLLELNAEAGGDAGYVFRHLPPVGSLRNPKVAFDPKQEYVLVGAPLQGFYQRVAGSTPASAERTLNWTVSLPEYAFAAQLVRRGLVPAPLTGDVRLEWALGPFTGVMRPGDDGISFTGVIPAEALAETGAEAGADNFYNPYPAVIIRAFDTQSGALLAESALVVGIAPEFGCAHCHGDLQYGVLQAHDRRRDTALEAQARSGQTVECRACHSGLKITDASGGASGSASSDRTGANSDADSGAAADDAQKTNSGAASGTAQSAEYQPGPLLGLSAAVHSWHTPYLAGRGEAACLSCHTGLGLTAGEEDQPRRLFMRDLHQERGLSCVRCHGVLEEHALALLQAERAAGQPLAGEAIKRIEDASQNRPDIAAVAAGQTDASADDIRPRLPWVQQPDCTGCHNFAVKPRLDTASGFNKWTEADKNLFGKRAENTGRLRCISCHGAPHAIYPAKNPLGEGRDNIPPQQYQNDPRVLGGEGNCALCHRQSMPVSIHHNIVRRSFTQLHVPEGAKLFMPQVRFSHDAHKVVECMNCHHTGHVDGQPLRCTAAGCHDQPEMKPAGNGDGIDYRYFRNAFHDQEYSCNTCHAKRQQQNLPAGPTNCQGCHRVPSLMWNQVN